MTEYNIEKLDNVIQPYLQPGQKIVEKNVTKLPQAGYGSIMLKIALTVQKYDGSEEKIYVVAKILPNSEIAKQIFNVQVTFKNEVAFYSTILPSLEKFRKDNGLSSFLHMFAKFYGARANLDSSNFVDDNAVLIMENLFEQGFTNIDRTEGFDLQGAEFLLKDLATFHGTTIAFRLKQPWLFERKVKVTCKEFKFPDDGFFDKPMQLILEEDEECAPYISHVGKFARMKMPVPREPYATVVHNDMWVNNSMQKIENGKIVANKFVDFQAYNIRTCASDVFFFIFTSVKFDVLQDNIDHLFKYYHRSLVNVLHEFKIDLKPFSYKQFIEDVKHEAQYEFSHALQFVNIVKALPMEEISDEAPPIIQPEEMVKNVPLSVKEHLWFLTKECNKRGWL